jgi:hypothetical protein
MATHERVTPNLTASRPDSSLAESERSGERPQILGKGSLAQIQQYHLGDPVSGYELYIPPSSTRIR